MENNSKKIIFFGFGSIGCRHAKLLQENFDHELWAYRTTIREHQNLEGVINIHTWGEVDDFKYDVAFITNPTGMHIPTAIECARRGMHLFIEKPLSNSMKGVDELRRIVAEKKLVTYVAYPFRHHQDIKILREYCYGRQLSTNRITCKTDARKWPSRRELDDVFLELSHEIDYAEYIYGEITQISPIAVCGNKYRALLSLTHKSGKMTEVDLDLYWPEEERSIGVMQVEATDQMYLDQLQHFFDNIENPRMMNNIFEASVLLRKIMAFRGTGG